MSIILPTAPANFYTPSLTTLKDKMEETNGSTAGQITLLTAAPNDANTAWAEVGAGNKNIDTTKGTLVAGQAPISLIVGPVPAISETAEEYGYKLEFAKVPNIEVELLPGASTILVGFALIVGRDNFSQGTNDDVRYLAKLEDALIITPDTNRTRFNRFAGIRSIPVNDGDILELPQWNLIINYAEPLT